MTRWAARNWSLIAAGLVAALPVILSTAHSLAVGWTPVGDDAVIAARSYDVFTAHPPLLGQYSAASAVLGDASYSLGPMLYWLLAVPARFGGAPAMAITIGFVNAAAAVGAVAIARRRGGQALMIVAAATFAATSGSLVGHTYSSIWNPAAGLLPFTLLIFLTWSIGSGEHRLLPLAALVASFAVQCHLTYLLPALGLLAVAAGGLIASRRRPSRRTLVATAGVLLVCWSAPLLDEAVHRPGNVEILARTAVSGTPTVGAETGARAVVRTVGVVPWWLRTAGSGAERLADVARAPSALAAVSAVLALAGLVALLVIAIRRRRAAVALAAAQGLVLCAGIGLVTAGTPTKGLLPLSLAYTLWWGTAAGAWAWMTLAVGAAVLLAGDRLRRLERAPALGALAATGGVAVIAGLAAAGPGEDVLAPRYAPMRALASRIERTVPNGATVLVSGSRTGAFDTQVDYEMGSVYALRQGGQAVISGQAAALGSAYRLEGRRPDYALDVQREAAPPPSGAQVLARIPFEPGRPEAVLVTLRRVR
jgi:hypothetical protein